MIARERLDAYCRMGLDLFLDGDDRLRVRGPKEIRDVARPALLLHRDSVITELKRMRAESAQRLLAMLGYPVNHRLNANAR